MNEIEMLDVMAVVLNLSRRHVRIRRIASRGSIITIKVKRTLNLIPSDDFAQAVLKELKRITVGKVRLKFTPESYDFVFDRK